MCRTSVLWQLVPPYRDYLPGGHGTLVYSRTLYGSTTKKTAKFFVFFAKSRRTKYLSASLIIYTTLHKLYYKRNNKKMLALLLWSSGGTSTLCRFGASPEAGRDHVHRLLDPFPRGGRCRPEGSDQDGSQLDGGVMAPEAGEDVLRHSPSNRSSLCLQEVLYAALHVL
jgi:hypothetical protein